MPPSLFCPDTTWTGTQILLSEQHCRIAGRFTMTICTIMIHPKTIMPSCYLSFCMVGADEIKSPAPDKTEQG